MAWVYYFTHSGLSYSRSFVQSLILITVIIALVICAIGNSMVTAIGLMGALAIIRFRNMVKDTRDIAFIFCAIVSGMTCGSQHYVTAVAGTGVMILIILYLHWTEFGAHQRHNGFLQFELADSAANEQATAAVLKRFCRTFTLISARKGNSGQGVYAYQVMVRNPRHNEALIAQIEAVPSVRGINLTIQEQLLEV